MSNTEKTGHESTDIKKFVETEFEKFDVNSTLAELEKLNRKVRKFETKLSNIGIAIYNNIHDKCELRETRPDNSYRCNRYQYWSVRCAYIECPFVKHLIY